MPLPKADCNPLWSATAILATYVAEARLPREQSSH